MKAKNQRVLVISDQHHPFCHPDTWKFLSSIKSKYKPDRVVCVGDEVDHAALSYHESAPELDSAGPELEKAIKFLKPIYKMFPNVDVLASNHGSLVYRKAKTAGIPRHLIVPYNTQIQAPKGWKWHFELTIRLSDGKDCYFTHGKTSHHLALSKSVSMNACSGHYHEKFSVHYWGNSSGLYWQMSVGCLVDDKSLAFAYNKINLHRPVIGVGMIINGQPLLIPMVLGKNGRWIGKL